MKINPVCRRNSVAAAENCSSACFYCAASGTAAGVSGAIAGVSPGGPSMLAAGGDTVVVESALPDASASGAIGVAPEASTPPLAGIASPSVAASAGGSGSGTGESDRVRR
jgi:hypothetical protein